ncbi:SURF4-domain-containing protein [Hesseltinella vesiculosa]|uniref:SURF4-domain-containing protein n=1 Tax=Hesseltinella vesiculosa TaxID=101127 RepID=A0A1X2GHL6_9FUNG|nr:SURF4-domain-containing protein [Hesseltinella vesiculosa]
MEDALDKAGRPLKPLIPLLARFLIVFTFLEDSMRIYVQWEDQVQFFDSRRSITPFFSQIFLGLNILVMVLGSFMVVFKKRQDIGAYGLMSVLVSQAFAYGLAFHLYFFLRNLSVLGGLMMVLSDVIVQRRPMFAALPELSETSKRRYFQLGGRILLIFLFLGSFTQGKWTLPRIVFSVLGLLACIMVVVGFKAKHSAIFLVLLLSVSNVFINNFWTPGHNQFKRDFLRYDFFQNLSTIGGFLLLISVGPGNYSFDEHKKSI